MLRTHPDEGLVSLQLFGQDPDVMRSAAAHVARETDVDLIDLNMGCPVPKVMKTGAGAALLKDPETAVAVARAAREGCDYVTVSPVHPTGSKPGYGPPLGLTGLARLARQPGAPPAYALAGVDAGNAAACLRAGAYGVAVMGEVMRAAEPARTVAALLEAIDAAPAG